MGANSVYCVSILYNLYAGCIRVAPDIKKERRLSKMLGDFWPRVDDFDLLDVFVICSRSLDLPGLSCGVDTLRNSQSHDNHRV